MQLTLRGPSRITSAEDLLGMPPDRLMSFKCVPKEGEEPLSLNEAEVALIRCLKGHVWHLNMSSESIGHDFKMIDGLEFDNFRISDKWTQLVEVDINVAFNNRFRSTAPNNEANTSAPNAIKTAAAFKKGIKRYSAIFAVLKEDNQ